jgi:hypothetical protein
MSDSSLVSTEKLPIRGGFMELAELEPATSWVRSTHPMQPETA